MQAVINVLGLFTVGLCAVLLLRAYGRVRKRLLLWSGLCFVGLTISNALVVIDLVAFPDDTFYRTRLIIAALSVLVLVYGLIFESD